MTPKATDLESKRQRLLWVIRRFFNSPLSLRRNLDINFDPEMFDIHLGVYQAVPSYVYPPGRDAQQAERFKTLGLKGNFLLSFDQRPIRTVPNVYPFKFGAGQAFSADVDQHLTVRSLHILIQRADLAWDDYDSMVGSGFDYARDVAGLSPGLRQRNFRTSLPSVKVPYSISGGHVERFHRKAALRATYAKWQEGYDGYVYYPKWSQETPTDESARVFSVDNLSDEYLRQNLWEPVLRRRRYHLAILLGNDLAVFRLAADGETEEIGAVPVLHSPGFGDSASNLSQIALRIEKLSEKTGTRPRAVFFYVEDGGADDPERPSEIDRKASIRFDPDFGLNQYEQIVDPRAMVKSRWGQKPSDPDEGDYAKFDDWDWFAEMLKLYFPEPMGEIHFNRAVPGLVREQAYLKPMRRAAEKAEGPFKKRIQRAIRRLDRRENLLVLAQGAPLLAEHLRFVGTYGHGVMFRNQRDKTVVLYPLSYVEHNLKIQGISSRVYQNTRGMIPIMQAVVYGGLAAVALPLIGVQGLVAAGKHYVKDYLWNEATKRFFKKHVYERFRTTIITYLVEGVMSLFPESKANTTANKIYRLIYGFVKGYSTDTIDSLLQGYKSRALSVVRYYEWGRLVVRVEAAVRKLLGKIDRLAALVTDKVAAALQLNFSKAIQELGNGFSMLFSSLYFLEYEFVDEPLSALSEIGGLAMPTETEWEARRKERHQALCETYGKAIQKAEKAASGVGAPSSRVASLGPESGTGLTSSNLYLQTLEKLDETVLAEERERIRALRKKKVKHPATVGLVGLIGGVDVLSHADFVSDGKKALETAIDVLTRPIRSNPLKAYKPKDAERFGQILGHLFGVMAINKGIFKKGTLLGHVKLQSKKSRDKKVKKRAKKITKAVGHSYFMPILDLLLSHVMIMLERYKSEGQDAAVKIWDAILKELNDILLGEHQELAHFQTKDEKKITFARFALFVRRLDDRLLEHLTDLASSGDLGNELLAMAEYLKSGKIPSYEELSAEAFEHVSWSRRADLFVMLAFLHTTVRRLDNTFRLLFEEVAPEVSLISLLKIVGVEISEKEAGELFDQYHRGLFDAAEG